jgi:hypothetical protein
MPELLIVTLATWRSISSRSGRAAAGSQGDWNQALNDAFFEFEIEGASK